MHGDLKVHIGIEAAPTGYNRRVRVPLTLVRIRRKMYDSDSHRAFLAGEYPFTTVSLDDVGQSFITRMSSSPSNIVYNAVASLH